MNLKDLNEMYIKRIQSYLSRQDKIRLQIEALKIEMEKMGYPRFDNIFAPLFKNIQQELQADGYQVYGPFGIYNQRTVYWLKDNKKNITIDGNVLGSLVFVSDTNGWKLRNEDVDTGQFTEGTIGEMNGMNHPEMNITDEMDMEWLLNYIKK